MALIDNLISYYKLDEIVGTNADDAHGANDGTADNARVFTTEIPGVINTGADFEGGNDKINTGSGINDAITSGPLTINLWIKVKTNDGTGRRCVYMGRDNTGAHDMVQIATEGGNVAGYFRVGTGGLALVSAAINTGQLYMITLTRTGNDTELFVDSVSADTDTNAHNAVDIANTDSYWTEFGADTVDSLYYDGMLDEIGIWSRVLTQTEIDDLYNEGNGLAYPFEVVTNMKINISDVWKDIESLKINIGDVWKNVIKIQQNIGDVWKTVFG